MITVARLWLTCGAILAGTAPGAAQGLAFGAKGGVNLATLRFSGDEGPTRDPLLGAVAGGFVVFPMTAGLGLQVEGLYAMKGVKTTDRGIEASLLLDYLEVPILARFTRRGASRSYYLAGGPALGLRLRARTRADFGGVIEEIDVSDQVEPFDLGIAAGGGIEFGRLVIDGRYTFGVRDIDRDPAEAGSSRNRAITITAGWTF